MTEATLKTVTTGSGEVVLATTDIGGGEVAHTTEETAKQINGFAITILSATSPVALGDLYLKIEIENTGTTSDTQDITLAIDGTVVNTISGVSLSAGASTSRILSWPDAGSKAVGFYSASVASDDDTESRTVEVVDSLFEQREDPTLGTVLEVVGSVSVFDDTAGGTTIGFEQSLDNIDTLVFTPQFRITDASIRGGERTHRIFDDGFDTLLFEATFDEDGNQTGGPEMGVEVEVDVSSTTTKFILAADDGLAIMK